MKKIYKYIITILIGILFAFIMAFMKNIFQENDLKSIFHILSDCFFVPGVIISSIGGLIFVSNEGVFDGLVFAVSSFFKMFGDRKEMKKKTYRQYKEEREKKKTPMVYILISGLVLIGISFVMLVIYNNL